MAASEILYAGDKRPKAYELTLIARNGAEDFTEVVAWSFQVQRPDGKRVTWDATASGVTPTSAVLTHVFATDGSDLPLPGAYDVVVILSFGAAGEIQSDPVTEFVQHPYGVRV